MESGLDPATTTDYERFVSIRSPESSTEIEKHLKGNTGESLE